MANISLCMIVKNEEKHLARCLESARPHVDEIVIVDTGSTDTTLEIARRYGAKISRYRIAFGKTAEIVAREGLNLLYCGAFEQAADKLERSSMLNMPMEELAPPLAYALFQSGRPEKAWTLYQKYRERFYRDTGGRNTAALLLAWKGQNLFHIEGTDGTADRFVRVHDRAQRSPSA